MVKGYKRDQELLELGWQATLEVTVVDDGAGAASGYTVWVGWIVREASELCTDSTNRSRRGETVGRAGCRRGGVRGRRG